jgi:hypothetical protein
MTLLENHELRLKVGMSGRRSEAAISERRKSPFLIVASRKPPSEFFRGITVLSSVSRGDALRPMPLT